MVPLDFYINDYTNSFPVEGTLYPNQSSVPSLDQPNCSSPAARGHHYTLNKAIVSHFLCLIDPTATKQCGVWHFFTAAETAACLGVRHVICNYLVVVFLLDRPSVDSMQYTCWSVAEVRGSAGHSSWSCLFGCNDIVPVLARACETLVWWRAQHALTQSRTVWEQIWKLTNS